MFEIYILKYSKKCGPCTFQWDTHIDAILCDPELDKDAKESPKNSYFANFYNEKLKKEKKGDDQKSNDKTVNSYEWDLNFPFNKDKLLSQRMELVKDGNFTKIECLKLTSNVELKTCLARLKEFKSEKYCFATNNCSHVVSALLDVAFPEESYRNCCNIFLQTLACLFGCCATAFTCCPAPPCVTSTPEKVWARAKELEKAYGDKSQNKYLIEVKPRRTSESVTCLENKDSDSPSSPASPEYKQLPSPS